MKYEIKCVAMTDVWKYRINLIIKRQRYVGCFRYKNYKDAERAAKKLLKERI